MPDPTGGHQDFEGLDRLRQWDAPTPVQEIKINPIGCQALEAALAGRESPFARGMLRKDFADEENLLPAAGDCFSNQPLRGPITINLGRVNQRQSKIKSEAAGNPTNLCRCVSRSGTEAPLGWIRAPL